MLFRSVLTRASGEVFLGGRVGGRGWQFPQGGVNRGERVEEALFRELKEEIGLERGDVKVLASTRGWLRYRLPRQYVRDRCIGQKQRWFLLKLVADESRLRFDATGTPEFDRWRWADYWTPVREVVYFKRRVYVRALHDLGQLMFPFLPYLFFNLFPVCSPKHDPCKSFVPTKLMEHIKNPTTRTFHPFFCNA